MLTDLLFPPRCALCRLPVTEAHTLCSSCFMGLSFLSGAGCAICGHPLPYAESDSLCGECLREAPPFTAARAALHYDEHSRSLVTRLKYGDQHQLLPLLGRWMMQAGHELAAASDVIVPVPLHWRRQLIRRFNQSHLLGKRIASATGLPINARLLKRRKHTRPQVGLTRPQREQNVAHAFTVPVAKRGMLSGLNVLLVDDVLTSGATLEAASKVLLRHGAAQVRILTVARRVLTGDVNQSADFSESL